MKHYLSVFAMLARGSVWRVLILLCLMAAGQCGRFLHRLNTEPPGKVSTISSSENTYIHSL